tara:strand:- start:290 stop:544 length:255 start_codon:yes stop_codon:yes gene_type:complete
MKGQIEVLGTNQALSKLEGFKGEGSLLSVDREHHCLMLGEEKLFYQIYRSIHAEDCIEYEGWCSDKDSNVGRIGIKFTPFSLII